MFSPGTSVALANHSILFHHPTSGADTVDQIVVDVPSGLSLTPPKETKRKLTVRKKSGGGTFGTVEHSVVI
jgi:hypothetical protein